MKSVLDPSFRYVSSVDTDVRKTFARIREEQRLAADLERAASGAMREDQGGRMRRQGAGVTLRVPSQFSVHASAASVTRRG